MMQVDVSPDMGMYHLLRSQGYDPAYAIAEFVDNAVQAHLSSASANVEPVKVDIRFYSNDHRDQKKRNSIVVEDNGPGITRDRIGDAMKPAKPSTGNGLSEFGIGMKAAAVGTVRFFVCEAVKATRFSAGSGLRIAQS